MIDSHMSLTSASMLCSDPDRQLWMMMEGKEGKEAQGRCVRGAVELASC